MRLPNLLFIAAILLVVVTDLVILNNFQHFFGESSFLRAEIGLAQREKKELREEQRKLEFQLLDLEQSVAMALTQTQFENLTQKRLAEGIRQPASIPNRDFSSVHFESGRKYFKQKNYAQAVREFEKLLHEYPLSEYKVEAHFMLSESYYLMRDFDKFVKIINQMLNLFPEHELTGFALLRLASLNEANSREREALEILKTIEVNFRHPYLQEEVKSRQDLLKRKIL